MNDRKVIDQIYKSILNAETFQTKLPPDIFSITGFSSNKVRIFLNTLFEIEEDINYLEIGVFQGSTFASSLHGNKMKATAIDNWSTNKDFIDSKIKFINNTKNYEFELFDEDCFSIDLNKLSSPINFYLFDGGHKYDDHYNALKYYYPILADKFVLLVDDFDPVPNWEQVERATRDSIKDLNLKVIFDKHIPSTGRNSKESWWNGYYVALLEKND